MAKERNEDCEKVNALSPISSKDNNICVYSPGPEVIKLFRAQLS